MVRSLRLVGLCLLVVSVLNVDMVQAGMAIEESGSPVPSRTGEPLHLTLKGALAAAINNNPDVLLYHERIREARAKCARNWEPCSPIFQPMSGKPGERNFLVRLGFLR